MRKTRKRSTREAFRFLVCGPRPPLAVTWSDVGSVVYVKVKAGKVKRTHEVEEDVVADYDANGDLLGFEIIGAMADRPLRVPGRWTSTAERARPADQWVLEETLAG